MASEIGRTEPETCKSNSCFQLLFLQEIEQEEVCCVPSVNTMQLTIFSSIDEGYDSVRKWTSKFDIFTKKYIIVPINEKCVFECILLFVKTNRLGIASIGISLLYTIRNMSSVLLLLWTVHRRGLGGTPSQSNHLCVHCL